MNCDEMAGNRLTVCEQELLYAFTRLVSISSNSFSYPKFWWTFLADSQKTSSEEIGKNEHAHYVRFFSDEVFKPEKARRRRTTPRTRKARACGHGINGAPGLQTTVVVVCTTSWVRRPMCRQVQTVISLLCDVWYICMSVCQYVGTWPGSGAQPWLCIHPEFICAGDFIARASHWTAL